MVTITTSKGKTYSALYAGVGYLDMLKMQIMDARPLGEIAPEIEGCETISSEGGERAETFTGYTRLHRIERVDAETVVVMLEREKKEEEHGNN